MQGRMLFDLAWRHGVKDRCNLPDIVLLTKISNDVAPGTMTPTLFPVFEITTDIIGRPNGILKSFCARPFSINLAICHSRICFNANSRMSVSSSSLV